MKMIKKMITMLVAFCMAFSVTGCMGGSSSSKDTGSGSSSVVDSTPEGTVPDDDSTPDDSTPDDSTPDDSTPDDSTPDDSTPDDSTPDDSTPDDSTPDDSTPDDSTPDDSTPDDSTPDDSTPDDSTPDDSTPDDSTPDDSTSGGDEIPDDEIPDDPVEPTLAEKYAFNAKNSVSSANGGLWDINSGNVFVKEWDATANAMKITMVNASAYMQGRDFVTYTTIEMLKEAQSAGYAGISFKVVSADGAFTEEGRGLRVYSKQNAGRDTAGITTNAGAGIYEYKDFGVEAGTTEITVVIDIEAFLALNVNANYVGIVLNMPANTTAYFSDFTLLETVEKDTISETELLEKYGFNEKNSPSRANGGIWESNSGGVFGKEWDATANATRVNMVNANANISARDFVMYTSIAMLKEAQSAGYAGISFKVVSTDGAFTDEGRGLRVYSKTTEGRAGDGAGVTDSAAYGTYVYGDFGLEAGTTEITITINIEAFLALNANANYVGIVLNMPANTSAYFSDLTFLKTVEEEQTGMTEAELMKKYGFTEENSLSPTRGGIWDSNTGGVFGKGWDATANATKVNMVNANANISARDFVMYTSIQLLKDAQAAGYTKISFKVTSTDGAFTDEGRGLRVFNKQNAGRDTAGITTNASAGIYEYKDFGIEAGTTEITVTIDIAEFLALNANGNYIGIVLNMPVNTTAYFSDMQFLKN